MNNPNTPQIVNGVNMDTLQETVKAVREDPDLARSKFHIQNKWLGGGYNQSVIKSFYGAGQEHNHQQVFAVEADEPPILAGKDQGPNPVEHLLHALAGCLTSSIVYHAALRGIVIEELESQLEGDLDLRGFMGLSQDIRKGYQNIRVKFRVKTDAENLERLKELTRFSPVFDVVSNGTAVEIEIEKNNKARLRLPKCQ